MQAKNYSVQNEFRARGEEEEYHALFGRLKDDKKHRSTAEAQHEDSMAYVNLTWSHCKNQVGSTQSKSFNDTAWSDHGVGMALYV
jgi:hypothetical protein